jgi:hypothetical protein
MIELKDKINDSCSGIRPKTQRRVITLDLFIEEYCSRHDREKEQLLKDMKPADLREICYEVSEFSDRSNRWLFGISNRSLKDYIKTLRYFSGSG